MTDPSPTPAEPQPFTAEETKNVLVWLVRQAHQESEWGGDKNDPFADEHRAKAQYYARLRATLSSLLEDQKRMEYTDRVKVVLGFAEEEARSMGAANVTTAHLLLGILREGEGVAMAVLTNLSDSLSEDWITLDSAREMTARLFGLSTGAARTPVQHQKG